MTLAFQSSLFDDLDGDPELEQLGDSVQRIELTEGAWLDIRPGWVSNSDALFERLAQEVPWQADKREMYDRVVAVPRLVSWFGPDALFPDPVLESAQADLNKHYGRPKDQVFETAGLCFYRTGDDSVAWHGDRVGRAIDRDTMVAIVSVGAARTLSLRPKAGGETQRFALGHGDLLVMGGSCQRTHEHAILKTKQAVGPRISIQFRPHWKRLSA
ncbi:alpha-ketoglutarate-dependent dioxygenase AlkB [Subtercola boreus]|uniref:Alpha-ketoglutarate-dependent dioxygenase AlkB n=1 Tax=Subtercola boreus TaxID=120213 RepID=A0A3E0WDT8_9MICO|nr:alpha-ketoglutarate-dependent dioxygenase AlkB [Subtercola boreus]RFA23396.1 alpha-ketoglutarate-dependent dioxygenase AlkB [Subtercola boreus]RFA23789.1 alpha-ketoglutarate-dependent dioxygenase AlkB [Subtercola boreus]RFA29490.1 alpha-ketoglutarate-dependent dioxygenase AlkB [Subtercola boreus]